MIIIIILLLLLLLIIITIININININISITIIIMLLIPLVHTGQRSGRPACVVRQPGVAGARAGQRGLAARFRYVKLY